MIHTATGYGVKAEYHMQFFNGVAAVQVWTVLKNEEPKPSVWNMSLPLSIRDSARAGKNRILKRRVCILRTIAGTVRVSGEK